MNIWQILGIEPTKDIKKIKTAYADKSKVYHPEEHPEEFQQLQAAYKTALQYAKQQTQELKESPIESFVREADFQSRKKPVELVSPIPSIETHREQPSPQMTFYDYEEIPEVFHQDETVEGRFFREAEYMIWHPYVRQRPVYWKCFLDKTEYAALLLDETLRKRFWTLICVQNFMFHSEARNFLISYWKQLEKEVSKEQEKAFESSLLKGSILSFRGSECVVKAEKEIYNAMWTAQEDTDAQNAEQYLLTFFQYAELNEQRLRSVYVEASETRKQRSQRTRTVVGVTAVLLIRYVLRYVL